MALVHKFFPDTDTVGRFSVDFCGELMRHRSNVKLVRDRYQNDPNWRRDQRQANGARQIIVETVETLHNYLSGIRQSYGAEKGAQAEAAKLHKFYSEKIAQLEDQLTAEKKAKDDAMRRLSEMSAQILKSGNPQLADLSDQFRPTKIGEKLGSLYDDDWSDALEALTETAKLPERESCDRLYQLLTDVYDMCNEAANGQIDNIERALTVATLPGSDQDITAMTQQVQKLPAGRGKQLSQTIGASTRNTTNVKGQGRDAPIGGMADFLDPLRTTKQSEMPEKSEQMEKATREFRKNFPMDALPRLKEDITRHLTSKYPKEVMSATGKYVDRCIELCWLMKIQFPPMVLTFDVKSGDKFNTELYNYYSGRGSAVDYVTWPPIYLYKGGPLMSRGTAQGLKDKQDTKF